MGHVFSHLQGHINGAFRPRLLPSSGGAAFSPLSLFASGEKGAWYDPSDLATMFQNSNGTTAVAVGDPVGYIADKSGNAQHWIQATAGNRPILRQTAGGLYYLEFDGAADSLSTAFAGANNMFISAAAFRAADDGSHVLICEDPIAAGFIGVAISGSATASSDLGGNIQYSINGATFAEQTRAQYNTAFAVTDPHVIQIGPADVATWGDFKFSGYTGLAFKGGLFGCVVVEGVTGADALALLTYHAEKSGATVSYDARGSFAVAIGDSTVAAYLGHNAVISHSATAKTKIEAAVSGDTIAQQRTRWEASGAAPLAAWVVIQVGLNDLDPAESAATAIARLQGLVDQVRSDVPTQCKVLVSKMIPCRARLINIYGAINGQISYQKWLDMNEAIAGGGAHPITGVDGRVTAHEPLLNDGAGNLAAAYEIVGIFDGIHENNAGRIIIADAWDDALTALGVL